MTHQPYIYTHVHHTHCIIISISGRVELARLPLGLCARGTGLPHVYSSARLLQATSVCLHVTELGLIGLP